jgi:hypothetical protein
MLRRDIKVGGRYLAVVSGRAVTVKVLAIRDLYIKQNSVGRTVVRYDVVSESTGRHLTFRSAARFLKEVVEPEPRTPDTPLI